MMNGLHIIVTPTGRASSSPQLRLGENDYNST